MTVARGARSGTRRSTKPTLARPARNRRNAGQFRKGQSGNAAGRPEGVPNKATAEAKAICARLLDDPAYRARLRARLLAGKLAPALECLIWHYRFGKPKDRVEVEGGDRPLEIRVLTGVPLAEERLDAGD